MYEKLAAGCTTNIKKELRGLFSSDKDAMVLSDWPEFDKGLMKVLELNFQERDDLSEKNLGYWKDLIVSARKENPEIILTAHSSFFYNKHKENPDYGSLTNSELYKENPFNLQLEWLVVPENYVDSFGGEIAEINIETLKKQINFCQEYQIKNLTFHVTKPGAFLSEKEFSKFIEKIKILEDYAHSISETQKPVVICVETGGVKPSQLKELIKKTSKTVKINYDTAHAILDNSQMSAEDFNLDFIDYLLDKDRLGEVHLCEVVAGADIHAPLYSSIAKDFGGNIKPTLGKTMNNYILRRLNREANLGNVIPVVLETKPDALNFEYIHQSLSDAEIYVVCGLQGSGKSMLTKELSHTLDAPIIGSDEFRAKIFTIPAFTETERAFVYDKMAYALKEMLATNTKIVLDATFYKQEFRDKIYAVAEKLGAQIKLIKTTCPDEIINERLKSRKEDEASLEKYLVCKDNFEPIKEKHFEIDTSKDVQSQLQDILD